MDVARPYASADRAACLALFDSNVPLFFDAGERSDFEEFLDAFVDNYRVVERDGRIVACGGWEREPDGTTASLCWGMVDGSLHGRGLGAALTEARIAAARAAGDVAVLRLDTGPRTTGFYARFGFVETGVTPDGYAPGYDRHDMALRL